MQHTRDEVVCAAALPSKELAEWLREQARADLVNPASYSAEIRVREGGSALPGYFSVRMILLSFVIASLAGFAAFESIEHTRYSRRPALWTFISGLVLGLGIWSMHFTGMMAWIPPFATYYSVNGTMLSMLTAVGASWLAMRLTVNYHAGAPQRNLLLGAVLVGSGVCGMHYLGMAAMHFEPPPVWSMPGVLLSYLIAVIASLGAMAMLQRSGAEKFTLSRQTGASLVIGLAICGMHYTGMLAMMLPGGSICVRQPGSVQGALLGRIGFGNAMIFLGCLLIIVLREQRRHRPAADLPGSGPVAASGT